MGCGQPGKVSKTVNSNVLLAIMKAHADGIDVLRRGDADPRCVLGVTVAKAQAPRFLPRPPQGARLGLLLAAFSPGEARASGEVSAGDQTTPRLCQAR